MAPFAVRALERRLGDVAGTPAWAAFAPAALRERMGWRLSEAEPAALSSASSDGGSAGGEAEAMIGQVWRLARTPAGTRAVQEAFDSAGSDEVRAALAEELQGRVWEAARCPYANYVLQKLIMTMQPSQVDFIIEEIRLRSDGIVQMARHKYGCRIVQRLLEHCLPSQTADVVQTLLASALALARDPFGNYVLQKILETGGDVERAELIGIVTSRALEMACDSFACPVVGKAVAAAGPKELELLAAAMAEDADVLAAMSRTRQGSVAVQRVLEALGEATRAAVLANMRQWEHRTRPTDIETLGARVLRQPCVH